MLPVSLIIPGIIALVLHILFTYLIPPLTEPSYPKRAVIATLVIILTLLFWFVLPVRVG